eukprot:31359-Pelagococcus_subviridis.AAC.3
MYVFIPYARELRHDVARQQTLRITFVPVFVPPPLPPPHPPPLTPHATTPSVPPYVGAHASHHALSRSSTANNRSTSVGLKGGVERWS